MSQYLGFNPTNSPIYYFLSYNNEDAERVALVAKTMFHSGINLWYDFGISYDSKWEKTIAEKLKDSQAVILFFTKGILSKENSFVQKEYQMATKFFKRKVYIIMLDKIDDNDIPVDKVSWWIDIQSHQILDGSMEISKLVEKTSIALGIQCHEDKMNKIIEKYNELYFDSRISEAEVVLAEYLHGIALEGKVKLLSNIVRNGFQNTKMFSIANTIEGQLEKPLYSHMKQFSSFYECKQISIKDIIFTVGNIFFDRGSGADAHVILIWKNDDYIHSIGSIPDAYDLEVFYDSIDDILYITYFSYKAYNDIKKVLNITTIEYPSDTTICHDFRCIE